VRDARHDPELVAVVRSVTSSRSSSGRVSGSLAAGSGQCGKSAACGVVGGVGAAGTASVVGGVGAGAVVVVAAGSLAIVAGGVLSPPEQPLLARPNAIQHARDRVAPARPCVMGPEHTVFDRRCSAARWPPLIVSRRCRSMAAAFGAAAAVHRERQPASLQK
jgi:hypothetical protein